MDGLWYHVQENRIFIRIRVQPNAKKNEIVGLVEDMIKIKIQAQPVDNKANEMLISFFAKKLKVSKSKLSVVKGPSSRNKVLALSCLDEESLQEIEEKMQAVILDLDLGANSAK